MSFSDLVCVCIVLIVSPSSCQLHHLDWRLRSERLFAREEHLEGVQGLDGRGPARGVRHAEYQRGLPHAHSAHTGQGRARGGYARQSVGLQLAVSRNETERDCG